MKKNLFLSLLGLTGMLAFTLTPAFAQEAEEVYEPANEEVVVDSDATVDEGIVVDTESVEEVAEPAAEPTFEESIRNNPELVDELNNSMDELLVAIDDENFTNEFNAGFETPEDRAVATAGLGVLFAGFGLVWGIVAIIFGIIGIIALWMVFTKAGEKGWKAIIPIWNVYICYKIAGMKNWFWYLLLIAIIGGIIAGFVGGEATGIITSITSIICGIINIVAAFKLPRKYGWGVFTSILYVLFTPICLLFLGFGGSKYQG